jgi:hypothetical protein
VRNCVFGPAEQEKPSALHRISDWGEHCGEISTGPDTLDGLLKLIPTPDTRLRAVDQTLRWTVGLTKTIKLEGVAGVAESFELIRSRIRGTLAPDLAESLIESITEDLKSIR